MKSRSFFLCVLILVTGLVACRVNRPAITPSYGTATAGEYIQRYKELAVSEMVRSGVPASITLAQGMIESDYGRSTLARTANNHFGIKCHDDWKGPHIRQHDDSHNECFRKYSKPEDSFVDHSDFLRNRSRYSSLFELQVTDYKGWARGLKRAGYATNPDYAEMLIRKIEEYNLQYYDRLSTAEVRQTTQPIPAGAEEVKTEKKETAPEKKETAPVIKETVPVINDNFTVQIHDSRIMENNGSQYIIVRDGETIETIGKEFGVFRWEIQRFNDLGDDFAPEAGQILYIQPKHNKAEAGSEHHIAGAGDTMHSISQKYGVRLSKLYEYNRMPEGSEAVEGQMIWLRQVKPAN